MSNEEDYTLFLGFPLLKTKNEFLNKFESNGDLNKQDYSKFLDTADSMAVRDIVGRSTVKVHVIYITFNSQKQINDLTKLIKRTTIYRNKQVFIVDDNWKFVKN